MIVRKILHHPCTADFPKCRQCAGGTSYKIHYTVSLAGGRIACAQSFPQVMAPVRNRQVAPLQSPLLQVAEKRAGLPDCSDRLPLFREYYDSLPCSLQWAPHEDRLDQSSPERLYQILFAKVQGYTFWGGTRCFTREELLMQLADSARADTAASAFLSHLFDLVDGLSGQITSSKHFCYRAFCSDNAQ